MTNTESTNIGIGFWRPQDIESYKNTQYWPTKEIVLKIIQKNSPLKASDVERIFKFENPKSHLTTNNIWCVIINLHRQGLIKKNPETLEYLV